MRYFISLIILGGAGAIFFMLIRPELDKIGALRIEQADIEQSLSELQELAKIRDTLLSQYNAINPLDLARLGRIVPSSIDSGLFIAEMEAFAHQYNIILKSITIADEKDGTQNRSERRAIERPEEQPFKKLPISLAVSGSYASFRDFLNRLEQNTRIIDIGSIRFNSAEKDFFHFQVEANAYWIGKTSDSPDDTKQ